MKSSTYVREVERHGCSDSLVQLGRAAIYELSEPLAFRNDRTCTHVFVSSTTVMGMPETYAFPANEKGAVLDWCELDGSQKGDASHEQVMADMGYPLEGATGQVSTGRGGSDGE